MTIPDRAWTKMCSADDIRLIQSAYIPSNMEPWETDYGYRVMALPWSESGSSLVKKKLARPAYYDCRGLILTDMGLQIREHLERKSQPGWRAKALVKSIRTAWSSRPRFTRFTYRSLKYRYSLWMAETRPEQPMLDWSKLSVSSWSDRDREDQRRAWHDSELLAFWLCPAGIDAGITAHDRLLEELQKKKPASRAEIIASISGFTPINPREHTENNLDEILPVVKPRKQPPAPVPTTKPRAGKTGGLPPPPPPAPSERLIKEDDSRRRTAPPSEGSGSTYRGTSAKIKLENTKKRYQEKYYSISDHQYKSLTEIIGNF